MVQIVISTTGEVESAKAIKDIRFSKQAPLLPRNNGSLRQCNCFKAIKVAKVWLNGERLGELLMLFEKRTDNAHQKVAFRTNLYTRQ